MSRELASECLLSVLNLFGNQKLARNLKIVSVDLKCVYRLCYADMDQQIRGVPLQYIFSDQSKTLHHQVLISSCNYNS